MKLVALVARGAVTLTKTTYPLEGVNEILHGLDEGRIVGRGVLVHTSPDRSGQRGRGGHRAELVVEAFAAIRARASPGPGPGRTRHLLSTIYR